LSEHFGKQFYVENIGGAGGNIGISRAAKAAPDGYAALIVANGYVSNPALYDKVPYDPVKDFDPVTLAVASPMVLAVHPSLSAQTVKDLIAVIKANPGKYDGACSGTGMTAYLIGHAPQQTHKRRVVMVGGADVCSHGRLSSSINRQGGQLADHR